MNQPDPAPPAAPAAPTPAAPPAPTPAPTPAPRPATPPEGYLSQEHVNNLLAKQKKDLTRELTGTAQTAEEQAAEARAEAAQAAKDAKDARSEAKRYKMAATAQLNPALWDRVRGETDEEIAADLETLKGFTITPPAAPPAPAGPGQPRPVSQQGQPPRPPEAAGGSVSEGRKRFEERNAKRTRSTV